MSCKTSLEAIINETSRKFWCSGPGHCLAATLEIDDEVPLKKQTENLQTQKDKDKKSSESSSKTVLEVAEVYS